MLDGVEDHDQKGEVGGIRSRVSLQLIPVEQALATMMRPLPVDQAALQRLRVRPT
jgi:hypothetical protein